MRFNYKPNIYTKAAILVAVPVIFELAFAASLFGLQHYYQDRLQEEEHANAVVSHANEIATDCVAMLVNSFLLRVFGVPGDLTGKVAEIGKEYDILKNLCSGKTDQLQALSRIKGLTELAIDRGSSLELITARTFLTSAKHDVVALGEAYMPVDELGRAIRQFVGPEQEREFRAGIDIQGMKTEIEQLIYMAVLGGLLISFLLFRYILRGFYEGIRVLTSNTDLFARRSALCEPIDSEDEIGQLDHAFHHMADAIVEAEAAKQVFLGMVSHDVRTPLSAIRGYFDLLLRGAYGEIPAPLLEDAEVAFHQVSDLMKQISELLDLEKSEAGQLEIQPSSHSLIDVLGEALLASEKLILERRLKIHQSIASKLSVNCDRIRMIQLFEILLRNAALRSPMDSTITILAQENEGALDVTIEDNGVAIDQESAQEIFDRYAAAERRQPVSALPATSLPLCKVIAELHRGSVNVVSPSGSAAGFCVHLPQP